MTHTPLFALLKKAARIARHADHHRIQAAESLGVWANSRDVTRREFLHRSSIMLAGAGLVSCIPPRARNNEITAMGNQQEPVVIIGAGIAGLTCAWRLQKAGIAVRILEAQNRVGGRMFSLRGGFADNQVCELGGELIDTGHSTIRALASELGIELNDLSLDTPTLKQTVWHVGGMERTEEEVIEAFIPIGRRIVATLEEFGEDLDPTFRKPQRMQTLDRMSIREWFDKEGVSGWIRTLLDVAYTTEYGLETDKQSALNFLLMIDTQVPPFSIFGESDERFHVKGGNDLIIQKLAERLADRIETGTVVESIVHRENGRHAISVARDSGVSTIEGTHVVIAVPFTVLRDVRLDVSMSPEKRRAISQLGYGTNAKLMIGFSDRPWRNVHGSNGSVVTDLSFQCVWETSRLQQGGAGIITNFSGGDHGVAVGRGTASEQASLLVRDLERVYEGVNRARDGMTEQRFHWPTNRWVRGSYASYLPGQWTGIRGLEGESVGNLHFIGEHCSLDAQGFMEGGCETGTRAALEIATALGIEVGA